MTHIVEVKFRNWMRYAGEHRLELGPGCYAIVAEEEGDKTRSNGLGKSSFAAGLRWCLDGGKVADVDTMDELITDGQDDMEFFLRLSDGTTIERKRKRGESVKWLKVCFNGRTLEKDEAEAAIETALGLSKEERLSTSWSEQGDLAALIKSRSSETTSMVESWVGHELALLVEAGKVVADRFAAASEYHTKALGVLEVLKQWTPEVMKERKRCLAVEQKNYDDDVKEQALWNKQNVDYQKRLTLTEAIKKLAAKEAELAAIVVEDVSGLDEKKSDERRAKAIERKGVAHNLHQDALKEEARLKRLVAGEFDGACPVSNGFKCPALVQINARHKPNKEAHEKSLEAVRVCKTALDGAQEEVSSLVREVGEIRSRIVAAARAMERQKNLIGVITELKTDIKNWTKECLKPLKDGEEAPKFRHAPSDYKLKDAQRQVEEAQRHMDALPRALADVEKTAKEVRAHRLALQVIGPEGARKALTRGVASQIEKSANKRLADAGVSLRVKASWGRELGSLAEQCQDCGRAYPSSAKVKRCEGCGSLRGMKVKHEFRWKLSFTGGAAGDMGGLAVRCAAHDFIKTKRSSPWSVAVLDEISGQLDRKHRGSISAHVRKMLVGSFDQAFVISHSPDCLESCDKKILIKGGHKYSTISIVK